MGKWLNGKKRTQRRSASAGVPLLLSSVKLTAVKSLVRKTVACGTGLSARDRARHQRHAARRDTMKARYFIPIALLVIALYSAFRISGDRAQWEEDHLNIRRS